ncbi:MAG: hypothetical protein PGN15_02680 [Aeromicrobium erythreum]
MTNDDLQREAADPQTSAARLHEIAQADRETWPLIAAHPQAYDGLLEWLGEHGDDTVREAIAARAAAVPPPPPPPGPPAPPEPPVEEPTLVAEPVAPAPAAATAPVAAAQPTTPTPAPTALESDGAGSGVSGDGTTTDGANGGGTSVARVLLVLGVIAALVAGGYFGIRALTGDDDSSSSVASSAAGKSDDKGSDKGDDEASGSGDSAEFCSVMKDLRDSSLSSLDNLNSEGGTPDLDALRKQLDETAAKYEALRKAAPAEIADDVKVLADLMSSSASASSSGGTSPFADFSSKEYLDASTKVSQYYYTHCST